MSRRSNVDLACKVYVGNLARDTTEGDLDRAFNKFGTIAKVWVARDPPGFAFVEFDDERDADDAIRDMDGRDINGARVRVERSNGKIREKPWNSGGGGGRRDNRCYECGEPGHFAADCRRRNGGGGGSRRSRTRSRSPAPRRGRDSRSRSYDRRDSRRDRSRSRS